MTATGPRLTEKEFQAQVIQLARLMGYRMTHFRPARTARGWCTPIIGDPGFVDLVLAKPGRVLMPELKVPPNKTTADQDEWLRVLDGATVWAGVWEPKDWPEIERKLTSDR